EGLDESVVTGCHAEVAVVLVHRELVQNMTTNCSSGFIVDRGALNADSVNRCLFCLTPDRLCKIDLTKRDVDVATCPDKEGLGRRSGAALADFTSYDGSETLNIVRHV